MFGRFLSEKDREVFWRLRREMKAYFSLLSRRAPSKCRVLIFAQGRTGSTVLENLLASTGHFKERGELLGANNERVRFPASYLKGLARLHSDQNFQCHVKIYHLTTDREAHGAGKIDVHDFLRSLVADGWAIIHLQRRDKFLHYVSGVIAKKRSGYHKLDSAEEDWQITIDLQDLKRGIATRQKLDQAELDALTGLPHLSLVYEEDLLGPESQPRTIEKILNYLDLEQRPAATRMKKVNSRPLADTILNYDDAISWAADLGALQK